MCVKQSINRLLLEMSRVMCYNDVDFYGETFRHENENKNCVRMQDLKRLKYAYYIILDIQKERKL